jgi:RimJ/RimL family protein N-acetyltransferase
VKLTFKDVSLGAERELLANFLVSHNWPYHSGSNLRHEALLHQIDTGQFFSPDSKQFWIIAEPNKHVGLIKLFDLDDIEDGNPLFDLRIHTDFRGQGIGKKAVTWLTQFVFESYPRLGRLEGNTRVDNIAMRKVFLGCGYLKEGHIRKSWATAEGKKLDTVIYGILREDWLNKTLTPVAWDDEATLK